MRYDWIHISEAQLADAELLTWGEFGQFYNTLIAIYCGYLYVNNISIPFLIKICIFIVSLYKFLPVLSHFNIVLV